jgi:hypothetical protein
LIQYSLKPNFIKDFVVPEHIISIRPRCFFAVQLNSITVNNKDTVIPRDAFDYTHLQTLNINAPITGGGIPQYSIRVNNIHLGKDVDERIQPYFVSSYFYANVKPNVTVEDGGLLKIIDDCLCTLKGKLLRVLPGITNLILTNEITELMTSAGRDSDITKVTLLSEYVTEIPEYCFYNNRLTELDIPAQITTLGSNFIYGRYLKKFKVRASVPPT